MGKRALFGLGKKKSVGRGGLTSLGSGTKEGDSAHPCTLMYLTHSFLPTEIPFSHAPPPPVKTTFRPIPTPLSYINALRTPLFLKR